MTEKETELSREEYAKLKAEYLKKKKDMEMVINFVAHELRSPLNAMLGFSKSLAQDKNLNDTQRKHLEYFNLASNEFFEIVKILNSNLISEKEKFPLEDVLKEINSSHDLYMNDNKIGLTLRYTPIEITENKPLLLGILKTITENSLLWVPKYSRIKQGIRMEKTGNLEILIENKIAPEKRKGFGEGNGIGLKTSRNFIQNMGGEFHNYKGESQIINNTKQNYYSESKKYGNIHATDHITEQDEVYGVKIRFSLKE